MLCCCILALLFLWLFVNLLTALLLWVVVERQYQFEGLGPVRLQAIGDSRVGLWLVVIVAAVVNVAFTVLVHWSFSLERKERSRGLKARGSVYGTV